MTSVIIQLSHGHSQEDGAAAHIASAEKYGIVWHGYHFYEGTAGEVEYSTSNAKAMGLKPGAYMFLDMEGDIGGDWQQQFYDFRTVWLSAGWKTGIYTSDSPYRAKFDDAELTADGVYRWIAAYSYEPANYDIWQYSSTGGVPGYSKDIDKDYDRSGKLSIDYTAVTANPTNSNNTTNPAPVVTNDPYNPPDPVAGAHVGVGVDTTGLAGGQAYGYSTNGSDFYTALSPYGFIFRQRDADRMWPLLKPKIDTLTKSVSSASAQLTVQAESIATKADQSTVDTLQKTVDSQGTALTQTASSVAVKADQSTVDTLSKTVSSASAELTVQAGAIKLKADSTTVNSLADTVSSQGTQLAAQAGSLALTVSKSDLTNSLAGYATQAYTQAQVTAASDKIQSTVSAVSAKVDSLPAEQYSPKAWTVIEDASHDLNTVTQDGRYWCKATMDNAPESDWAYLFVDSADPSWVMQRWVGNTTAQVYVRMCNSGTWTPWHQVTYW